MAIKETLLKYYKELLKRFGPQHWWPAETRFEVMVGAILTQNAAWTNVEKAIMNLKSNELMDPHKLYDLNVDTLALVIRSTGYFNIKASRLKNFIKWFVEKYQGNIKKLMKQDAAKLRDELLSIKGIGKETADSILLYALDKPTFVVDLYTYRVLSRHALISEDADYDEIKSLFEENLRKDPRLYNEYHALLVAVGKNYCKTNPLCAKCPLQKYLPHPL